MRVPNAGHMCENSGCPNSGNANRVDGCGSRWAWGGLWQKSSGKLRRMHLNPIAFALGAHRRPGVKSATSCRFLVGLGSCRVGEQGGTAKALRGGGWVEDGADCLSDGGRLGENSVGSGIMRQRISSSSPGNREAERVSGLWFAS